MSQARLPAEAAPAAGLLGATTSLTGSQRAIYSYVTAHRDGASYLMALPSE